MTDRRVLYATAVYESTNGMPSPAAISKLISDARDDSAAQPVTRRPSGEVRVEGHVEQGREREDHRDGRDERRRGTASV